MWNRRTENPAATYLFNILFLQVYETMIRIGKSVHDMGTCHGIHTHLFLIRVRTAPIRSHYTEPRPTCRISSVFCPSTFISIRLIGLKMKRPTCGNLLRIRTCVRSFNLIFVLLKNTQSRLSRVT